MQKILLATVYVLAFAAPSFGAEEPKTVGQAPPSGASSFYVAQNVGSNLCQIAEFPQGTAPGAQVKVIGTAYPTRESAETAMKADKTCVPMK